MDEPAKERASAGRAGMIISGWSIFANASSCSCFIHGLISDRLTKPCFGFLLSLQIIHVDGNLNVRKQIMREMQFMHDCNSKHIVSFYGAYMNGTDIAICMEYMDVGYVEYFA
jgi:serine/threonine protein kinase